jgi:hypothetical protein
MGSFTEASERYTNPETAALSVVESLESRGYKYNTIDGVRGSTSVSTTSISERYNVSPSKDEAIGESIEQQIGKRESSDWPRVAAIAQSFEEKNEVEKVWGENRAQVKPQDAQERVPTRQGSTQNPQGAVFRATASQGSSQNSKDSLFRAKVKVRADKELGKSIPILMRGGDGSNPSTKSEFDPSRIMYDSFRSDSDTTAFDESTISTKSIFKRADAMMKHPNKSNLSERAITSVPSETSKFSGKNTVSTKRVGFSGEFPQLTSKGGRVPEIVTKRLNDDLRSRVSDLSSMPKSGQSIKSSISFQGLTEDRIERFFEQCFLTCRLTVFQPK